jgi:acetyl-CoA C-acetyltransferase
MIHGLFCGSRLLPGPENGPLKEGSPIDLFKGKPYIMGHTAEFVAQLHNISREEMDVVALRSHNNAERATNEGDFKEEIFPIEIQQKKGKPSIVFDKDEHFMPGLTIEKLAALPLPLFRKSEK